jgi:hypothetical protein
MTKVQIQEKNIIVLHVLCKKSLNSQNYKYNLWKKTLLSIRFHSLQEEKSTKPLGSRIRRVKPIVCVNLREYKTVETAGNLTSLRIAQFLVKHVQQFLSL